MAEIKEMIELTGRYDYLDAIAHAEGHTLSNLHVSLWQEAKGRPARRG